MVATEPAGTAEPGEGTLHDPPPRQDLRAGDKAHVFQEIRDLASELAPPGIDDLHVNAHVLLAPLAPGTRVAVVGPEVLPPGERGSEWSQHQLGADPIMATGGMDHDLAQPPQGVDQQMPPGVPELSCRHQTRAAHPGAFGWTGYR